MRWSTIWLINSRSFAGNRAKKVKRGVQAQSIFAKLSFHEEGEDESKVTSPKPVCFLMVDCAIGGEPISNSAVDYV